MSAEAVLLVGGQGTRLRPLTLTTPKPLLPVAGVPFLAHQIAMLRDAGVDHVVLATSYKPQIFVDTFGDGAGLGVRLTYVEETEPLGTGGAIGNVAALLESAADDPVVVLNGDVLSGHDLAGQLAQHKATGADVTLHLVEVPDARAFGCVPTDDHGRVLAFLEKMPEPVTSWVNAGAYVFRRSLIDAIPSDRPVSVERETFPQLLAAGASVFAWRETAYWVDLGTPEAFRRACVDLVTGDAPSHASVPDAVHSADALSIGDCVVDATARVTGGSTVGSGARVGPSAVVDACVLFDGAVVESGAHLVRSVIGAGAHVAADCVLVDAVVGDGARIGRGNELRSGIRVWPGVELAATSVRFSSDQ